MNSLLRALFLLFIVFIITAVPVYLAALLTHIEAHSLKISISDARILTPLIVWFLAVISLICTLYAMQKEAQNMAEGKEICSAVEIAPYKRRDVKIAIAALLTLAAALGFMIVYFGLIEEKMGLMSLLGVFICFLLLIHWIYILISPQTVTICKNGIKFDFTFVKWDEIDECSSDGKKIMLKFKNNAKILKNKAVIRYGNDIAERIKERLKIKD